MKYERISRIFEFTDICANLLVKICFDHSVGLIDWQNSWVAVQDGAVWWKKAPQNIKKEQNKSKIKELAMMQVI